MKLVWATQGSHLLLSIYYNHLQSANHYIPCPLATWGLSGRHGGLTSFFYLLLSSPINKSLYSQPPGNLRPVWATRGSHLQPLSIIIIFNPETNQSCFLLAIWGLSGRHGGSASCFSLLKWLPSNYDVSCPPTIQLLVWVQNGFNIIVYVYALCCVHPQLKFYDVSPAAWKYRTCLRRNLNTIIPWPLETYLGGMRAPPHSFFNMTTLTTCYLMDRSINVILSPAFT